METKEKRKNAELPWYFKPLLTLGGGIFDLNFAGYVITIGSIIVLVLSYFHIQELLRFQNTGIQVEADIIAINNDGCDGIVIRFYTVMSIIGMAHPLIQKGSI